MSWTAFFLLFVSVFLHAGWNFLSKSRRPSAAFYMLASATSIVLWSTAFLTAEVRWGELPAGFWLLVSGSVACEVLYFYGLFRAYRLCDISMAYPLARALPVVMVALITILFGLGRTPGGFALAGMAVVSFGCLLIPLATFREFRLSAYRSPGIGYILLAAIGTTGYTVLDSLAIPMVQRANASGRLAGSGAYLFLIEAGIFLGLGCYVLRRPGERGEFRRLFLRSFSPSLCGLFASGSYVLVLLAMEFVTSVSFVQAFRQMSLPLGVLAGIFLLKESHPPVKLAGIALVFAGLLLTALN